MRSYGREEKINSFTKLAINITNILLLIALLFSIIPIFYWDGVTFIPMFLVLVLMLMLGALKKQFNNNGGMLKKSNLVLYGFFVYMSIGLMFMSVYTNYDLIYRYTYWDGYYGGDTWEYWVVFGLACVVFIINVIVFFMNLFAKKTPYAQQSYARQREREVYSRQNRIEDEEDDRNYYDRQPVREEKYVKNESFNNGRFTLRQGELNESNNEQAFSAPVQMMCACKPEKEKKIVCDVCGYANPEHTAQCKMCSNYLTKN